MPAVPVRQKSLSFHDRRIVRSAGLLSGRFLGMMKCLKAAPEQSKTAVDFSDFAARTLRARWRKYRRELKKCGRKCTESSVHNLRVAIRRLSSALEAFSAVHTSQLLQKAAGRLDKELRLLGPLRDTHVQGESIRGLLPRFPELKKVSRFLRKQENKSVRELGRKIRTIKVEKLKRLLKGDLLRALERLTEPSRQEMAEGRLRRSIDQAFAAVAEKHARLDAADPDSIHAMRIAFKHFRYRVEALHPILPEITQVQLEQMRRFQLAMGRIQDREILLHLIQSFHSNQRKAGLADFRAVEQVLTRQQAAAVKTFVHTADRVSGFWKGDAAPSVGAVRARKRKE